MVRRDDKGNPAGSLGEKLSGASPVSVSGNALSSRLPAREETGPQGKPAPQRRSRAEAGSRRLPQGDREALQGRWDLGVLADVEGLGHARV